MHLKTFGIWLGFPGFTPMKREGIIRYVLYLTKYIIKNYKIKCEIWCYEINKNEVELLFCDLMNHSFYENYIIIKTENHLSSHKRYVLFVDAWRLNSYSGMKNSVSWKSPYKKYAATVQLACVMNKWQRILQFLDIIIVFVLICRGIYDKMLFKLKIANKHVENSIEPLAKIANCYSKADCFIIPVFLLTNALQIKKPKLISLHDLHLFDFYDLFVDEWGKKDADDWLFSFNNSVKKISDFLLNDKLLFVSNCDYVRHNHTLKYIKNVDENLTDYVYLPVIIPDNIKEKLLEEDVLKQKYKIDSDYIFFPTQVRPYKNVIALLNALNILVKKNVKIKVVLTGAVKDSKLADRFVNENKLSEYVIQTGDVSEEDLYSLHKYAMATVVTTLFEGGFPWPALEALYMDTPVILSKIPMVVERVESVCFNLDNCGLRFFDPNDFEKLSKEIEYTILNRDEIVKEQSDIKQALLAHNWDEVSRKYYNIITSKLLSN